MQVDDRGIEIGWRKAREVLYYLLHHRNGVPPDTLCEAIWPELPARRGRDTLWTAIHLLRKHLPAGCIVFHGRKLYRFNRDIVLLDYDVEQFLQLLSTNNSFEAHSMALDLYQGSYLPWSDTPWTVSIRTDMEQRYLQTLRLVAASYEQRNAYEEALNLYRRMLELDPLDEATHARVMNCQIILGNRAAAVEQYGRLRHVLNEELGLDLDPASEAERLYCDLLTPA
ncbi:MAG: BTAD domain-containing putative transcriptional regulator [Chloroflexaceae bacterium]